jgi:hypothetical protein
MSATRTARALTARRLAMMLVPALLMAGAVVGLQIATAQPAHALCVTQPLTGNWHNIDSATRSITRVDIGFHCGDTILCDEHGNCTGGESYFTLRPYGKCHPTDCDWGVQRAQSMGDGWERASYNFGFKTSHVWVKTYATGGITHLRVWVYNDFTPADGRTDYSTNDWMVK